MPEPFEMLHCEHPDYKKINEWLDGNSPEVVMMRASTLTSSNIRVMREGQNEPLDELEVLYYVLDKDGKQSNAGPWDNEERTVYTIVPTVGDPWIFLGDVGEWAVLWYYMTWTDFPSEGVGEAKPRNHRELEEYIQGAFL